jgi:predicted PurR-regulated permease PerM
MTRPFTTELLIRRTCGLIIAIALVAVLYLAREVFLPLTLAILMAFLLSSPVKWLERKKVPRVASVILVIALAGGSLLFVITVLSSQVVSLANDLPKYKLNIFSKVQSVKQWTHDSTSRFITLYDDPETHTEIDR